MSYQDERNANVPQMMSIVDPYVYQGLQSLAGKTLVVETCRGSVRGQLADVKPDHIVVNVHGASFFVRIQEIIWFMPQ